MPLTEALPDPTGLKARATGNDSGLLSWTAVANADSYEGDLWSGVAWGSTFYPSSNSHPVTGLSPSTIYRYRIKAIAPASAAQEIDIECVADKSPAFSSGFSSGFVTEDDQLDGTYFILYEPNAGDTAQQSRAFYFNVSGVTPEPSHGADVSTEITGVTANMTAMQVAAVVAAAIDTEAEFAASAAVYTPTVSVTNDDNYHFNDPLAGTSGFTVTETTPGSGYTDSGYVEFNQFYTLPDATGYYLGANEGDTGWTRLLIVTGTDPFFQVASQDLTTGFQWQTPTEP